MREGLLLTRVLLRFGHGPEGVVGDLSAVASGPDGALWLGSDELRGIERLETRDGRTYGAQSRVRLADHLEVPPEGEVDLEGLDLDGPYCWVTGSHGTVRKKPKGKKSEKDLRRLATVEREPARFVLGRIPLADGGVAATMRSDEGGLLARLEDDPHLGPFVRADPVLPGKDNGFDVEGIAVRDGRVHLGLRGPVLRGYATVLDFDLSETDGRLAPAERIRKRFLDLDGLGIRELCRDGDDLLVLAGPTMVLDGAIRLYRWKGALDPDGDDAVVQQAPGVLEPLFEIPHGDGVDRAEGVARTSYFDENDAVLVVYDSPAAARRLGDDAVLADVFHLRPPA